MNRITKIDNVGIALAEAEEGLVLRPYRDQVGIPTIGIGSTYYENGTRVTLSDPMITKERAYSLFMNKISQFEKDVDSYTRDDLNQNQFDALVDFAYNAGSGALKTSTLLKKVNANPSDPTIRDEFNKWIYAHDAHTHELVKLDDLVKRRKHEADLYFKPIA